jgi:hypothetical protein
MKKIAGVVVFGILLFSCDKAKFDIITFVACKDGVQKDSLATYERLIGTWNWVERYCPCCLGVKPAKADKKVEVIFKPDLTYAISENAVVVDTGKWELLKYGNYFYISIKVLPATSYLQGSISICDKQLLSDLTPLDGCKQLFNKVN